jgi:hypothetical protein
MLNFARERKNDGSVTIWCSQGARRTGGQLRADTARQKLERDSAVLRAAAGLVRQALEGASNRAPKDRRRRLLGLHVGIAIPAD